MKIILEFDKFKPEYRPIKLEKRGIYLVNFDVEQTEKKEKLIRSIINDYYPETKNVDFFTVNGKVLSSELLNKSQKNLKILYIIADLLVDMNMTPKSAEDIIDFIDKNRWELFDTSGAYFENIYGGLLGVSESGYKIESKAVEIFKKYASDKGFDIEVLPPNTKDDDKMGIDAYFKSGGKDYTIQIKTLSYIKIVDDFYHIYINGDITSIKTHYLVLIPEDKKKNYIDSYIFKGSGIKTSVDDLGNSFYIVPITNVLYQQKTT